MSKIRKLFLAVLCACMTMLLAIPVMAESDSDKVNAARNGVLQVNLVYVDNSGNTYPIQGGSGFLISDQVLLTNQHVAEMSQETKTAASEAYGVDFVNDNKLDVRLQVVVQRDVVIDATIKKVSAEMDVAIVELSEPIYDRTPLKLGDSASIIEAQKVYALGFPAIAEMAQDINYYTNSDVTVTDGIVAKKVQSNGTPVIQHSAKLSAGNSGGPLLDTNGCVIAINQSRTTQDEYYYAIEINEIKNLLKAIGVTYTESDSAPAQEVKGIQDANSNKNEEKSGNNGEIAEPAAPKEVDKKNLEEKIAEAEKVDSAKYSKESFGLVEEKLDNANTVFADGEASQESVDKAAQVLTSALDQLEEKTGPGIMLWVIIGGIILAVIIVVVVVIIVSNQKKKNLPIQDDRGGYPSRKREETQDNSRIQGGSVSQREMEGIGDTSVLSQGAGETTVLGAGACASAYLIRKKTGESIMITGPGFTIGKERRRVNYCISDNTSISRCHAQIVRKGNQYFIADMNSTNFTFVNEKKVASGQEVSLNTNDVVRLADEEFEIHLT